MTKIKFTIIFLFFYLLVLIAGLTSDLSLGDETYHYRFAKDIYNASSRVAFDPLYDSGNPPGYFYVCGPLWHTLLASLWRLFGKISFPIAQLYHTIYYVLLILFTYLLGKELYGQRQGLYSALIIATVPAVAVFSVLFYLDIPAISLSILCLLLIVKRKFLWSGIILGLIYLTKRNACFFAPAFAFLIWFHSNNRVSVRTKNLLFFLVIPALFIVPDLCWRERNLSGVRCNIGTIKGVALVVMQRYKTLTEREQITPVTNKAKEIEVTPYSNALATNPRDLVKYLGPVLLVLMCLYLTHRRYQKKDLFLWIPIATYILLFAFFFYFAPGIRYMMPVVPLLAILSSKAIVNCLNKKWLKVLLIILCLLQFSSTVLYVRAKRQIPKGIEEGFAYLRDDTASDALIIYPEYVILEATNRRFAWTGNLGVVLTNLFWDKDEDRVRNLLKSNNVDYIAVKKSRVYDDSKVHHFGGYPKSFVEKLPKLSFVKLVFDNKDMSIWQVE